MKKGFLTIGLIILCVVMFVGCSGKDKQVVLADDKSQQLELQNKDINESIELGNIYLKQGKYDAARKAYENAISKDSDNKENYLLIKDTYIENSRFDDGYYIIKLAINNNVDTDNMKNVLEEIKKNFQVINYEATVYENAEFSLPKKAIFEVNGGQQEGDINWGQSTVDTSKVGTFAYQGTVEEYGRTVTYTLNVIQNKPKVSSGELYKNDKLGFSINFPESWQGKYTIKEIDGGIGVYFKPNKDENKGYGLLFAIIKKGPDLDENHFDTVSKNIRYFNAKGITYVVGGPTDFNFDEKHPEVNVFMKMSREAGTVAETIKSY